MGCKRFDLLQHFLSSSPMQHFIHPSDCGQTQVSGRTGAAGVNIFFVISGFVMVVSTATLRDRPDGWSIFIWRRLIRILANGLAGDHSEAGCAGRSALFGPSFAVRPDLYRELLFVHSDNQC